MIRETCRLKRIELGMTQSELAERSNIRIATVSDFENGKTSLGSYTLDRILEALDINLT